MPRKRNIGKGLRIQRQRSRDQQPDPANAAGFGGPCQSQVMPEHRRQQRRLHGVHLDIVKVIQPKDIDAEEECRPKTTAPIDKIASDAISPSQRQQPKKQRQNAQNGLMPTDQPAPAGQRHEECRTMLRRMFAHIRQQPRDRIGSSQAASQSDARKLVVPDGVGVETSRSQPGRKQQNRQHPDPARHPFHASTLKLSNGVKTSSTPLFKSLPATFEPVARSYKMSKTRYSPGGKAAVEIST